MLYTFGNSPKAANRLLQLAEFFNPISAQFIRQYLIGKVKSVVDLGCGPGYTTQMLADVTGAKEILGVDQSIFFIDLAKKNFPHLQFEVADVSKQESDKKFDLIYCRFLLSHMRNISGLISGWMDKLQPGGVLILDELEDIDTHVSVFKNYLQISRSLVKSQGAELFIGKLLSKSVTGISQLANQVHFIQVQDWMAAGWFYPNTIGAWKDELFIKQNVPSEMVAKISDDLLKIVDAHAPESNITWKMRRIILTNQTTTE
jgi:2-polyprenyl-3-methyl-5-hydroxy-6-metoxy-1,4-benzoquinol methylase